MSLLKNRFKGSAENLLEIKKLPDFLRTPYAASFLVAVTAFACPGMFGALNSSGAGSGSDASTANIANAITFGTIAVGGFLTGGITNQIGVKQALIIGSSFYAPYAAAMYVTNYHPSNKWFLPFAAFLLGVSAAFLWIASGAILLGYPTQDQKGKAMSIKFSFQNTGALVGSLIGLGMNHVKTSKRAVTRPTYLVLTSLTLVGIPFALLLPTPRQVQRKDQTPVVITKQKSIWKEFGVLKKLLSSRQILLMLPSLLYNQWYLSYQWTFNFSYFSLRGRSLNGFLMNLFAVIGAILAGFLLDNQKISRRNRSRIGFVLYNVLTGAAWILALVVTYYWRNNTTLYDWNSSGDQLGCFIFALWGFVDGSFNTYIYWIFGTFSNSVNELSILSGVINGIGSLGSAMAFVISAKDVSNVAQVSINTGLYFFSVPFLGYVAWKVGNNATFTQGVEKEETSDIEDGSGSIEKKSEAVQAYQADEST